MVSSQGVMLLTSYGRQYCCKAPFDYNVSTYKEDFVRKSAKILHTHRNKNAGKAIRKKIYEHIQTTC